MEGVFPTIDQPGFSLRTFRQGAPAAQAVEQIGGQGLARLDLDGVQGASLFAQQVHLQTRAVAPEVEIRRKASMQAGFQAFQIHQVLEKSASGSMEAHLPDIVNAQQPGGETWVIEVQLGGLDEALVEIPVMGAQQEQHVAGLQNGKPGARGGVGDAAIRGQGGKVEQLADAGGAQAHEPLEGRQIADGEELAKIPLHKGADIR
ncbi:hypothetical protein GALL_529650 [mine drainage metagenome]|uniref:Uncharacterized protein n=1 Tax=mine drainage metagenome TaxID=410659 RepID=A0A1J5PJL8_9ZZZZ